MPELTQQADHLAPAEALLDQLALLLADGVARCRVVRSSISVVDFVACTLKCPATKDCQSDVAAGSLPNPRMQPTGRGGPASARARRSCGHAVEAFICAGGRIIACS